MKIKALTRSISSHQPEGSSAPKLERNLDPSIHPFAKAREYQRALVRVTALFARSEILCFMEE